MPLDPKARAPLTARSGVLRSGAGRSGFSPNFVVGETPGTAGPFYGWKAQSPAASESTPEITTTWTKTT